MRSLRLIVAASAAVVLSCLASCTTGVTPMTRPDAGDDPIVDGGFVCRRAESEACLGPVHWSCTADGEFLQPVQENCEDMGLTCVDQLWCVVCRPLSGGCDQQGNAVVCREDGSGWDVIDECDVAGGEVCDLGACRNLCEVALEDRSYLGCDFYAADLDNAAIGAGRDASSQQYAIVVSNPGNYPTEVFIEIDTGAFGGESVPQVIESIRVLPGDLEVFELPRREVDGSSSFAPCTDDAMCGSATQACWCRGGVTPDTAGATDCRCRSSATGTGLNDGTHSALTSHAYRVRSVLPIVAYQFNPLDNVGVFSNDASLLLPTSGIGERYTVVGWPQTIAHSDIPREDFDSSRDDEDLRAFLTIIGTQPDTHVTITLGELVRNIVGLPGSPNYVPGDVIELDLGAFDVINLETQGFNADFTGTTIVTNPDHPVSVFSGSEASDAPRFDDLANRQCCADHLEEQIFPNDALGRRFFIGRTPRRSSALNRAFLGGDSVGDFNEPEYVRIVAASDGITAITTSMPFPDDSFELAQGESVVIEATQDLEINTTQAVAVLQVISSQEAVGIPNDYPGGDPAILAVPPVQQWRSDYVFLTPDLYAFDFVTIVANRTTLILLDERPIEEFDCDIGPADGVMRGMDDPPPDWVTYRCQLSFPDVIGRPNVRVEDGIQNDGYHTVRATEDVSVVVSGFDAFVSYAYVGGANLQSID
ncbi:MAG: IgGFc-binding protein [Myxococcota bacterium]|nr:IgGFc-binding protein [Myxococcota bacterium]